MQKLKMHSADLTAQNIEKIAALFPNCVTEREVNGKLEQAIDFDLLKQELSATIVEGNQERYQLNWVGKANATVLANAPINKTLRPCREESVNFDTTQNLFIEGDNLEALKLLQETYLGKVKMIYIDPPYNTGKDFIYKDNFAMANEDYQRESGQVDEEGNRLVVNSESNGRFHSDWLSMIYSRLKLARNLLTDDGVIFISIDDNEQANLKRVCDEVFGERNFVADVIWKKKNVVQNDARFFSTDHEYLICYTKNSEYLTLNRLPRTDEQKSRYQNPDNDPRGDWTSVALQAKSGSSSYEITFPNGVSWKPTEGTFPRLSKESLMKAFEENRLWFGVNGTNVPRLKKYLSEVKDGVLSNTIWFNDEVGSTQSSKEMVKKLLNSNIFDTPKPIEYIKKMMRLTCNNNSIILDFFAGSATTAHAVMQLNAEDGGNRKFIMVQIPEQTDEKSEAHKAGYHTIAEISKERIRRAGQKIKQEKPDVADLDIGFRVLKIDSSNMADIYYNPQQIGQGDLFSQVEHIKADRTEEDLLFQVLLDWGVDLTLPIEKRVLNGKNVYFVDGNALVACFDKAIDEGIIQEIAKHQPLRAVFRDDGFVSDTAKINADQLFKQLAPHSELRVI
ncbi:type III restriction-modification system methyltransferase [Actinobacillus pleuropneumoniae serovar 3 str. JL03]|uniref:site-specific DNA-methyltransferase (adenine-specific) n=1 Tax=Actinobacillus pleuropneumoniae serotype 3 (strain JL03) TaxID=434271 RepID=B0BNT9_ACTPJ|nr:site-specific DNA-methyltransferase [Actinobacillus pleuropneumoniae]ABY69224.1 type III restriction-modification system methyltransferase [Actinobacillus pleuropneumoniae serovar 3 str. JL03]UKH14195.1 site-specific DNA-methyltransferase [Actinobacillus pleuropneumoniae]UKH22367.1 site-specific DNA-methyltransferase [Actinobacillus pleuropneumoniae]UKH43372.1 site-specific DNA-methyltransferase [Actinobacillus pleuropneumoniae]USQ17307.1 site-specific DNA-methyltransferase [Actinobacillus 